MKRENKCNIPWKQAETQAQKQSGSYGVLADVSRGDFLTIPSTLLRRIRGVWFSRSSKLRAGSISSLTDANRTVGDPSAVSFPRPDVVVLCVEAEDSLSVSGLEHGGAMKNSKPAYVPGVG